MNIRIFSFPVFSSHFNLNNTDGLLINKIIPIMITSIDKIINIFISSTFVLCYDKTITIVTFYHTEIQFLYILSSLFKM